ncbi:CD209 antigen-like protein 2 [Orycteropus afer afer]|uniref:CD209 antigen-like protein 2 n=1 Tax=Orycteropus afer afer TaxID=1230840 RepID=A0AC54ZC10_ORYAF|nr:CD209 antigen-like protein 2 [Orycteropus afer afer]
MEEMGDFKEPGSPGCLTRVSLPLVLLLVSLGIFVLLVTTQVQVALSQKQLQSELKEIQEQLAWMNASLASLCRPCSQNWEPFQNSCYLLSRTQTNWHASVSACQDQGAHLVIVNSGEEQRFLQYWSVRKDGRTWIGLSDHHNEDAWHWVDNSPLQLSFWVKGEPNNAGDEDCAELSTTGWNDIKCDAENYWVCEKPSVPCTSL